MATNLGTLMATVGVDTRPLKKGLKDAERHTKESTNKMLSHWKSMAVGIVATYAVFKMAKLIKETALAHARFETLGVVMTVVGKNAGYSADQMKGFSEALQKTGISMIESRQSLARMAMAQLDLTKATQLGRIAQDAAVLGAINSSEAFQRMIYGIQSGNLIVLRRIGIMVNFEKAYKKAAEATGRITTSFTEAEKAIIRQNTVIEFGARIAGTYEAAMMTAGKKIGSFSRYVDDFKVKMGKAFGPATVMLVDAATTAMKEFQEEISKPEAQEALRELSSQLATTIIQLGKGLPNAIEMTTDKLRTLVAMYQALPEGVIGAAGTGLIGRMLFGSWTAAAFLTVLYLITDQIEKLGEERTARLWGMPIEEAKKFREELDLAMLQKGTLKIELDEQGINQFKKMQEMLAKGAPTRLSIALEDPGKYYGEIYEQTEKMKEIYAKYYKALEEMAENADIKAIMRERERLAELEPFIAARLALKKEEMEELASEQMRMADELSAYYAERLALEAQFNQEYADMGKSRFDLERDQIENQMEVYRKAGFDKIKIAELTSDKMKAIAKAETEYKISQVHSAVNMMTEGFRQISEMGGKYSKEAFAAYKAFKIVETLISTRSAAIKAYESLVSIPYVGPALAVGAAAAAVAFGMAQVAAISAMSPPSYDQGGISHARGLYRTGNIDEAHIPLESGGTIPVRFDSKSEEPRERTPINIINVNDPGQLDMYLASARGQDAILNVLGARSQSIRKILR